MTNEERQRFSARVHKQQRETLMMRGRAAGLSLVGIRVLLLTHEREGFDAAMNLLEGKPLPDYASERDRVSETILRIQRGAA